MQAAEEACYGSRILGIRQCGAKPRPLRITYLLLLSWRPARGGRFQDPRQLIRRRFERRAAALDTRLNEGALQSRYAKNGQPFGASSGEAVGDQLV